MVSKQQVAANVKVVTALVRTRQDVTGANVEIGMAHNRGNISPDDTFPDVEAKPNWLAFSKALRVRIFYHSYLLILSLLIEPSMDLICRSVHA